MTRRKFTSSFKTKVVLEAIKERSSLAELAQKYELQPTQISAWKKCFSGKRWYSPQHDNVDDLMSDIDKQNVQTILSVKALLEENGEHMINQRIVEFGMAG